MSLNLIGIKIEKLYVILKKKTRRKELKDTSI